MSMQHEIVVSRRRSLAERCYHLWHGAYDPKDRPDSSRLLFLIQCRCGARGSIEAPRWRNTSFVIGISSAQPEACRFVVDALLAEFPRAVDAKLVDDLLVDEQQRLAQEFLTELRRDSEQQEAS